MYFKIRNNILFRQYKEYGYITDNEMFGYRFLNDTNVMPGEKYVSDIGAIMLACLEKQPKHIDDAIKNLLELFSDVDYDELKEDTIEFFVQLAEEGFLAYGETAEECCKYETDKKSNKIELKEYDSKIVEKEDCSLNILNDYDFLRSVHIEIANECNERCVHCYIPHELKTKVIDNNLFYKIIDEARDLNILNVTISGGEPLLHKEILSFLCRCRELDFSVNVLTNLTLLTDEMINEMKKNPLLSVQTSIYSMNPHVHDSITKVKGSFEKTQRAVLRLLDEGIPVQISCPVMKQNKDSFVDVINWGYEHNIGVATDFVIFAAYDHSNANLVNRLSLEEVECAFEQQITPEYAMDLKEKAREKLALKATDPICTVCRYYFCVSAEGDVFPCVGWQSKVIGNLKTSTIKEIWEISEDVKELRKIKRESFPKCLDCDNRGYCTICMMCNSNENCDGNAFTINEYHCKIAAMKNAKIKEMLK